MSKFQTFSVDIFCIELHNVKFNFFLTYITVLKRILLFIIRTRIAQMKGILLIVFRTWVHGR